MFAEPSTAMSIASIGPVPSFRFAEIGFLYLNVSIILRFAGMILDTTPVKCVDFDSPVFSLRLVI